MGLRRLLLTLAALALIFGPALFIVYADYRLFLDTPLGVTADGQVLDIKPGMSISGMARELRQRPGILRSAPYLEAYARLNGLVTPITIVTEELYPPYDRVKLSKVRKF